MEDVSEDRQQFREFQAKMRKSGATTVYAARAMLVKNYVEQETRKLGKEGAGSFFSKSDDDESYNASISMATNLQSSAYYDTLSSMEGETSKSVGISRRRGSVSSSKSFDSDEQSQDLRHRHRGSVSGQQQERHGSLSQSQYMKRPSFSILNFTGGLSTEEKSRRRASMERRQGFDTMVNGMLGKKKEVEPPTHCRLTPRRGSYAPMSSNENASKTRQRCASMGAAFPAPRQRLGSLSSIDSNSVSEPRRGSYTGVVGDIKQLSAYLSTFVDDDDEDEEGEPRVDRSEDKNTGKPSASFPRTKHSSASEPVEIATDGKAKISSADDKEILVDFPTQPRRTSTETDCDNHHSYYSDDCSSDEEDAGVVETITTSKIMSATRRSLFDGNGEVFQKPANWINYDSSSDDDA